SLERGEDRGHQTPRRLIERTLVEAGERFGRKAGRGSGRGQREMKLGRPLPQQANRLEVRPDQVAHFVGHLAACKVEDVVSREKLPGGPCLRRLAQDTLQIRPDVIQCVIPGVAFVRDVRLEHGEGHRLSSVAPVLDVTSNRWHLYGGLLFRENAADLQVGVYSLVRPAEQLQYQLVTVDDRCSGLVPV